MNRNRMILPSVAISLMTVVSAVAGLNVALPSIARDTGATQTDLTWIVDAYTVVFSGLLMLAGAVSDRYGRRLTLTTGLICYGIASSFGLFVGEPSQLIAVRIVTGIGAAFIMPSTLSVITSSFEKEERAKAVSVWVGVAGGGAFIGLFGTSYLLKFFEWNSFFGLNLTLAVIGLLMTLAFIPESVKEGIAPLDWLGGALSVVGVGSLVLGIIEGPDRGWDSALSMGGIGIGVTALVLFVLHELRAPEPLIDPREFKNPGFSAGALSITIQFFGQFGFIFVAIQYLQYVAGFSAWDAAVRLLPMPLFLMPSARIAAHLSKRVPQKYLGAFGLTMFAFGLYRFSGLGSVFDYTQFLIALGFFGVGAAFSAMPATTAITNSMPEEKQGVASAVNDTSREFGSAVGIAILGSTLTKVYQDGMAEAVAKLPTNIAELVSRSPAFTTMTPPAGSEAMFEQLKATALSAFADGSSAALKIAAGVAVVGALAIFAIAPKKTHD